MITEEIADERMTYDEICALFGGSIPIEALNVLLSAHPDKTVGEVRAEITALAKSWSQPSLTRLIEAEIRPMTYAGADLTECVSRILALLQPSIEAARAEERELCAKMAEETAQSYAKGWYDNPRQDGCGGGIAASNTGTFIAAAIRSNGGRG